MQTRLTRQKRPSQFGIALREAQRLSQYGPCVFCDRLAIMPRRLGGASMRALLAIVIFLGGIFALSAPADAARKSRRSAHPPYAAQPSYRLREQQVCEEDAFAADPSGQYAGYPCWARKAFAPRGGRR